MEPTTIITLTTDFGLKDPFVALMKGVILGINPESKIIDISHNVQRHNIFEASQILNISYRYFPSTTIHIAIVDPGVGGDRRPILVVTEDYYFIGPDNGVFSPIYEQEESHFFKVYHVTSDHYFLPSQGSTFQGRDIFAPVAAWLSKGRDSQKFGEEIHDYVKIDLPKPVVHDNKTIDGELVSFDIFGNAISNIRIEDVSAIVPLDNIERLSVSVKGASLPFLRYYSQNEDSGPAALINSFGNIELFVYQGNACENLGLKTGDKITVSVME